MEFQELALVERIVLDAIAAAAAAQHSPCGPGDRLGGTLCILHVSNEESLCLWPEKLLEFAEVSSPGAPACSLSVPAGMSQVALASELTQAPAALPSECSALV